MPSRKCLVQFVCPECLERFAVLAQDLNDTPPICLNCGSRLLRIRKRTGYGSGGSRNE